MAPGHDPERVDPHGRGDAADRAAGAPAATLENDARRFFFIHVMKTGGSSFRHVLRRNFGADEVYPDPAHDANMKSANLHVAEIDDMSPERRERIRLYTCHFPFYATRRITPLPVTLTVLRDPVERTISFLKHCRRYNEHHEHMPLEEIYEDPWAFIMNIRDHQAKVFSLEEGDGVGHRGMATIMDVIEVDDDRLQRARSNLETVDLIGLHENYESFLDLISSRLGWQVGEVPRLRPGESEWDVSASFRRKIADDNSADMEFYEFARELVAERGRAR